MKTLIHGIINWLKKPSNFIITIALGFAGWWIFRDSIIQLINSQAIIAVIDHFTSYIFFSIFLWSGISFIKEKAVPFILPITGIPAIMVGLFFVIGSIIIVIIYSKYLIDLVIQ